MIATRRPTAILFLESHVLRRVQKFWVLADFVPGSDGYPIQPCDILQPGNEWAPGQTQDHQE